jgi:hypothetical protein
MKTHFMCNKFVCRKFWLQALPYASLHIHYSQVVVSDVVLSHSLTSSLNKHPTVTTLAVTGRRYRVQGDCFCCFLHFAFSSCPFGAFRVSSESDTTERTIRQSTHLVLKMVTWLPKTCCGYNKRRTDDHLACGSIVTFVNVTKCHLCFLTYKQTDCTLKGGILCHSGRYLKGCRSEVSLPETFWPQW